MTRIGNFGLVHCSALANKVDCIGDVELLNEDEGDSLSAADRKIEKRSTNDELPVGTMVEIEYLVERLVDHRQAFRNSHQQMRRQL